MFYYFQMNYYDLRVTQHQDNTARWHEISEFPFKTALMYRLNHAVGYSERVMFTNPVPQYTFWTATFKTYISKLILKETVRQHLSFNQEKLMFYAIGL